MDGREVASPSDFLCVAYSCPPILDPQAMLLAKMLPRLRRLGYRALVIGLDPAGSTQRTDPSLAELLPPDTEIARLHSPERRLWYRAVERLFPRMMHLPDRYSPLHRRAVRTGLRLARGGRPALIFSWAKYHSCALVALRLKEKLGLPWIAHFSDPWLDHPYWPLGPVGRAINARMEGAVVAAADALVFVNEETRDRTMARYPASSGKKAHVIPHCYEPALYGPRAESGGDLVFRHLGAVYGRRSIGPLLEAIAAVRDRDRGIRGSLRFEFIGRIRDDDLQAVRQRGLGDLIRIREAVGYRESLLEMRGADVLVLVEAPADVNLFLPSKVVDYLGAGRPILALTPQGGPAARLLDEGGDRVVPPDDPAAIASAIEDFRERHLAGSLASFARDPSRVAPYACAATMKTLSILFDRVIGNHERAA